MKRLLPFLLLALASCSKAPGAAETVQTVFPDPWAARLADAVLRATSDQQAFARTVAALQVRGRSGPGPLQGLLQDRGVMADAEPDPYSPVHHDLHMRAAVQLASLDYTRERVEALERAGVPVIEAAAAAAQGRASFLQQAILAPNVVIVEPLGAPEERDLSDGFATTTRLRVIETLKGDLEAGSEQLLRQMPVQGAEPRKRDLFRLQPGKRYLAYISNIGYAHWTLSRADAPALDRKLVVHHSPPRRVEDDRIAALSAEPALPLAQARREIARIAAADRKVLAQLPLTARTDLPPKGSDGRWLADSVDGRQVVPTFYWVQVRDGVVTGGYDHCNWWSHSTHRGEPGIDSTMVGCPDDPIRNAYHAVLMRGAAPRATPQADGSIKVALGRHALVFRRPLH